MVAFPPVPVRSTPLGLLTPFVIMVGIVVLLFLPNLFMHAGPGSVSGSMMPIQGQQAASEDAAAITAPMVR